MLQAGPPSLHYYCAVVLHSCIVLPPVGHSSSHQYHCCQLTGNRAVFRIFIALLNFSFDSPSYFSSLSIFSRLIDWCKFRYSVWGTKPDTECFTVFIYREPDISNGLKQVVIYLFPNIKQLHALNFTISLFQASTCFEHMCSSSGGQKLYYTVSGIITPIGGRPVHRLREELYVPPILILFTAAPRRLCWTDLKTTAACLKT